MQPTCLQQVYGSDNLKEVTEKIEPIGTNSIMEVC